MVTLKNIELRCASLLPKGDIEHAQRLIKERKYEDLEMLISSVIKLISKNKIKTDPERDYFELEEIKIIELYNDVLEYNSQFDFEEIKLNE